MRMLYPRGGVRWLGTWERAWRARTKRSRWSNRSSSSRLVWGRGGRPVRDPLDRSSYSMVVAATKSVQDVGVPRMDA